MTVEELMTEIREEQEIIDDDVDEMTCIRYDMNILNELNITYEEKYERRNQMIMRYELLMCDIAQAEERIRKLKDAIYNYDF